MNQSSALIIDHWIETCRSTIKSYDHAAHMNLISKQIQVFGIPGFDVINYQDWHAQSAHEFRERHILDTKYDSIKLRHEGESQIMFITAETIVAADHSSERHVIEVVLTKEQDKVWRVTQQRLLNQDEAKFFGMVV